MAVTNELLKAFEMFGQAATEYGVTSGIRDATDAVAKIKNEEIDALKAREAQQGVANQLQARLAGLGASGVQIANAVGAVAPEKLQTASDYARKFAETGKQEFADMRDQMAKNEGVIKRDEMKPTLDLQHANAVDLQQRAQSSAERIAKVKGEISLDKDQVAKLSTISSQYETVSTPLRSSIQQADRAATLLKSDNPLADNASLNSLVKASGDTGAITQGDRDSFGGSAAFAAKLARAAEKIASGKLDEGNRKFLLQVAEIYKKRSTEALDKYADRFAGRAVNMLGVDKDKALSIIDPEVHEGRRKSALASEAAAILAERRKKAAAAGKK